MSRVLIAKCPQKGKVIQGYTMIQVPVCAWRLTNIWQSANFIRNQKGQIYSVSMLVADNDCSEDWQSTEIL